MSVSALSPPDLVTTDPRAHAGVACAATPDAIEDLAQCQKRAAIGRLSGGLTHELNGPLGFVMSNFGTLERHVGQLMALLDAALEATAATPAGEALRTAAAGAELDYLREDLPALFAESNDGLARVQRLVRDLADYSRAPDGESTCLDIQDAIESALNLLRNEIKYKAEVCCDFAPLPPLWCVPSQIRQVLMILIANAAEAVEAGGRITVSTRCNEGLLRVELRATTGAAASEKGGMPFEAPSATRRPADGAEPALSLAAELVRRHGGALEALCAAGAGPVFRITLPLLTPPGGSAAEPG